MHTYTIQMTKGNVYKYKYEEIRAFCRSEIQIIILRTSYVLYLVLSV